VKVNKNRLCEAQDRWKPNWGVVGERRLLHKLIAGKRNRRGELRSCLRDQAVGESEGVSSSGPRKKEWLSRLLWISDNVPTETKKVGKLVVKKLGPPCAYLPGNRRKSRGEHSSKFNNLEARKQSSGTKQGFRRLL